MVDSDALMSGVFALASAGVYAFVGWRLSRRSVSAQARLPAAQFSAFWLGLAGVSAVSAVESLVATFQTPSLAIALTASYFEILILCVVLWGLLGYLVYLFTGKTYLVPLSVFYGTVYVLLLYLLSSENPVGVTVTYGQVAVSYAAQIGGPFVVVLFVVLILPEFIGSILYFTLFFRTRDRTIRYRVAVVSWSLIAWFGLSLLNVSSLLGNGLAAQIFSRSLGVLAGLAILFAYYPPRLLQQRYGVRPVDDVSVASA